MGVANGVDQFTQPRQGLMAQSLGRGLACGGIGPNRAASKETACAVLAAYLYRPGEVSGRDAV